MKALKITGAILGGLVLLIIGIVLLVWTYPQKILTDERLSGMIEPLVRVEQKPEHTSEPLVSLNITNHGFKRRSISVRLSPGCYALASEPDGGTRVCIEEAEFGVSIRLSKSTYIKLTGLDLIKLKVSEGRFVAAPGSEKKKDETPSSVLGLLKYLDSDFAWGPIDINIRNFEIPESKMTVNASIQSAEKDFRGLSRSPKVELKIAAETPDWEGTLKGSLYQKGKIITLPKGSVTFVTRSGGGKKEISLNSEVNAKYVLDTGDLDAGFAVTWRDPTPEISSLRAENGIFRMRTEELSVSTTLKVQLRGKTPFGRIPVVSIDLKAAMRPGLSDGTRPIDLDILIDEFKFAGFRAHSDLEITVIPKAGKNELRWRKGELHIATKDFSETIRQLARTPWAIPAPFNVFRGPITFRTEPFKNTHDRSTLPANLMTDLTSSEQAFKTESHIEIDLAKKDFGVLATRIDAVIKKIQIRIPDYDPLAPTPALARDPRIIRRTPPPPPTIVSTNEKGVITRTKPKAPKPSPSLAAGDTPKPKVPLALSVRGASESIVLLNRYFRPSIGAEIDLKTIPETGEMKGYVMISRPFGVEYLNREVTIEHLEIDLKPKLEVASLITMERGGYRIEAQVISSSGKTQFLLESEPPLAENEIVSLIIYGRPRNSISSEQTRSVGSAQAAMSSEALGIFSFWAFASTPVESVIYDPESQTYSAVVKLPGGIVASVGSNWENERQLALSKSLGKNWAVSTELIKDSEGVDRGGTLLRWRLSY